MKKHDKRVVGFSWVCPECQKNNSKRKSTYEDESASVYCEYSSEWIFHLTVDCDTTGDHVVSITGAWTNPIIQTVLEFLGVTKRKLDKEWKKNIVNHPTHLTMITSSRIDA